MFSFFKCRDIRCRGLLALLLVVVLSACDSPEEKAQSHFERGLKLLQESKLDKARLDFRSALQLNDKHVPALYNLSLVEERARKWPLVTKYLLTVVRLDPKHLKANIKLGNIYLLAGRVPKALEYSNKAYELAPGDSDVLALRSTVFFKLGDMPSTVKFAKQSLKVNPKNSGAIIVLAAERLKAGDAKAALAYLQTGLEINEKNISLQLFKIRALESLKQTEQVEVVIRRLVELYPKSKSIHQALARYYVRAGKKDEAEKTLRAIAAKFPDDFSAELNVIRYLNATKGIKAAKVELNRRIKQGGEVFRFQLVLARLEFAAGERKQAVERVSALIKQEKESKNAITARVQLARFHLISKEYDQLSKRIEEVLTLDGKNIDGLVLRASLKIEKGQYDPAITDLRAALNEAPRAANILILLARAHELNGSKELADERLALATKTTQYRPNVGLIYVRFLLNQSQVSRAEDILLEILRRRPGNVRALTAMSKIKLRQKKWLEAAKIAETLRKTGKDKGVADQILGTALTGQNKHEDSIKVFQQAFTSAPNAVQPMVSLVRAFIRANKRAQAHEFLKAVLTGNQDNAAAHVLQGNLYMGENKPGEAESSYKAAIARQPDNVAGYQSLAGFYQRQKRYDDAQKIISTGLEKQPKSLPLRLLRAGMLERLGEYDAAIREYEAINEDRPGLPVIANNLASLLAEHRNDKASLEKAYTLAKQFNNSKVPFFKDTLGWIQFKRGEYKLAIPMLLDASKALPDLPLVRYHLGMSYLEDKQNENAKKELAKALELAKTKTFIHKEKVTELLKKLESQPAPQ